MTHFEKVRSGDVRVFAIKVLILLVTVFFNVQHK